MPCNIIFLLSVMSVAGGEWVGGILFVDVVVALEMFAVAGES